MIFAKPGESQQQIGGECPDGWVVMLHQRPDEGGYIASNDGSWSVFSPTLEDEIEKAQREFDLKINTMNQAWLAASVRGGQNEISKKESITNEIAYLKQEHEMNIAEILSRHGV